MSENNIVKIGDKEVNVNLLNFENIELKRKSRVLLERCEELKKELRELKELLRKSGFNVERGDMKLVKVSK